MGDFLQAVSVDRFDNLLKGLPDDNILLFEDDPLKYAEDAQPGYLLAQVQHAGPAADMLAKVRTAESLEEALRIRAGLASGESVITPDGIWLSRNWVRVSRRDAESGGMLTRETQMRELEVAIAGLERQVERSSNRRAELKAEIEKQEQARKELNAEQTEAAKEHAAAAAQLARQRDELERSRQRALALGEDSQSIDTNISDVQNAVRESRGRFDQASEKNGLLQEREAGLREQQQQLQLQDEK